MNTSSILSHMNKDHQGSLYDYLRYLESSDIDESKPIALTDLTLTNFTIEYDNKTHVFPFQPKLKNLTDSRDRFIKLALEAANELNVSHLRLKTKPFSNMGLASLFVLCMALFMPVLLVVSLIFNWRISFMLKYVVLFMYTAHLVEYFAVVKELVRYYRINHNFYFYATLLGGFTAWWPLFRKRADERKRA